MKNINSKTKAEDNRKINEKDNQENKGAVHTPIQKARPLLSQTSMYKQHQLSGGGGAWETN